MKISSCWGSEICSQKYVATVCRVVIKRFRAMAFVTHFDPRENEQFAFKYTPDPAVRAGAKMPLHSLSQLKKLYPSRVPQKTKRNVTLFVWVEKNTGFEKACLGFP